MTTEQKEQIRHEQMLMNIPPDARDSLLRELEPRDEDQSRLKALLESLLDGKILTVLICGTEGNGKTLFSCSTLTSHAAKALNEGKTRRGYYITQKELELEFRSAMHDSSSSEMAVFRRFFDYPILVLDEVGRGSNTQYSLDNIEALISKRYAWRRPTVIITNGTVGSIRELFDRHILDRLQTGGTIEVRTKSQRR